MQFRLQTIVTVKLCPSRRLALACPDLQFGKLGLLQSLCVFLPRQGERTCAAAKPTSPRTQRDHSSRRTVRAVTSGLPPPGSGRLDEDLYDDGVRHVPRSRWQDRRALGHGPQGVGAVRMMAGDGCKRSRRGRAVGRRPRSSVGYLGRTVRIATAFVFREASGTGEGDCAATVEMASRKALANSRRFVGLTRHKISHRARERA